MSHTNSHQTVNSSESHQPDSARQGAVRKKLKQRIKDQLLRPPFGDDIFVSYSRADGSTYSAGLSSKLVGEEFACRFDQWGTKPGRKIPKQLVRALRRSALLVVVGTPGAAISKHVAYEVIEFKKTGRDIVPIIFEGVRVANGMYVDGVFKEESDEMQSVNKALWADDIFGAPLALEASAALIGGPSEEVLNRIRNNFTFKKRDERLNKAARLLGGLLAILTAAVLVALGATIWTTRQARAATRDAAYQQGLARDAHTLAEEEKQRAELERQNAVVEREKARAAATLAEEQTVKANKATSRANEQTRIAKVAEARAVTAKAKADEQESIAHRTRAGNFYTQAQIASPSDARRGIVWASKAVEEAPAEDPNKSIYGLMAVHLASNVPLTVTNTPERVRVVVFSDTGDKAAVLQQNGRFVLWNLRTGTEVGSLAPGAVDGGVNRPVFSRDGKWIAALVWDFGASSRSGAEGQHNQYRHLQVWNAETGTLQQDVSVVWKFAETQGLAFSPNGEQIIVFGSDSDPAAVLEGRAESQRMRVWERSTGKELKLDRSLDLGIWRSLGSLTAAKRDAVPLSQEPTRNWFLNVSRNFKDNTGDDVEVRNISKGEVIKRFTQLGTIVFADFSPDGRKVVSVSLVDDTRAELRVWDIDSGHSSTPRIWKRNMEIDPASGKLYSDGDVFPIQDISRDGTELLMTRNTLEPSLDLWVLSDDEWRTNDLSASWQEGDFAPTSGTERGLFTRDGKFVVETLASVKGFLRATIRVRVWDVASERLATPTRIIPEETANYEVSLANLSLNVALWDGTLMSSPLLRKGSMSTQAHLSLPDAHTIQRAYLTPDRRNVITLSSQSLSTDKPVSTQLFDVGLGSQKWPDALQSAVLYLPSHVAFSPDGERFVLASLQTEAGLPEWCVRRTIDGTLVPGFKCFVGRFIAVQFDRDGGALVTAAYVNNRLQIRKWNAASGNPLPGGYVDPDAVPVQFRAFTKFADYFVAGLGGEQHVVIRSVDAGRSEDVTLNFAEQGTETVALALLARTSELHALRNGPVTLTLDSGVVLKINRSALGDRLEQSSGAQLMFPQLAESVPSTLGLRLGNTATLEDINGDGTLLAVQLDNHNVRVWETLTGRAVSEDFWNSGRLKLVKFFDETHLLTVSDIGERKLWYVGGAKRKTPSWMARLGEALTGIRVESGTEIQRILQNDYLLLRQQYLKTLRKAAAAGDSDALAILTNWSRR